MTTERAMGDPLGAFSCPKCGGITIGPRLKWHKEGGSREYLTIHCYDCDYWEYRPTADASLRMPQPPSDE